MATREQKRKVRSNLLRYYIGGLLALMAGHIALDQWHLAHMFGTTEVAIIFAVAFNLGMKFAWCMDSERD